MKSRTFCLVFALNLTAFMLPAQVPQLVNFQGRVAAGGVPFTGMGQFKFAMVSTNGSTTYWSNDGTSSGGSEPVACVTNTVTRGLYAVLLGDTTVANMTTISPSVFNNSDVALRVWFNDGTNGFQQLTPDQRIAAVAYAVMANSVPDGAITSAKLAPGAVTAANMAPGSIGTTQIANGAVGSAQLASGAVAANLVSSGQAAVASGGVILFGVR